MREVHGKMGRKTVTVTDVDPKRVYEAISKLDHPRNKALIAMIYLTGARISEVLALKPEDITVEGEFMVVTLRTKKKRRGVLIRKVPVSLRENRELVTVFADWFKWVRQDQPIFYSERDPAKPIGQIWAWKILKRACPDMWLHLLRHIRLSELATKLNPFELMAYAGWTDVRPAMTYVHLGWKQLAKRMSEES